MKWEVVAKERFIATNTYIIEADTQDDAEQKMLDGDVEERTTSFESEREFQQIESICVLKDGV